MEHLKLFSKRQNIPRLIRVCEEHHHWRELVFLFVQGYLGQRANVAVQRGAGFGMLLLLVLAIMAAIYLPYLPLFSDTNMFFLLLVVGGILIRRRLAGGGTPVRLLPAPAAGRPLA